MFVTFTAEQIENTDILKQADGQVCNWILETNNGKCIAQSPQQIFKYYIKIECVNRNEDGTVKMRNVQNFFEKKYKTNRITLILQEIRLGLPKFVNGKMKNFFINVYGKKDNIVL